jgi:hypothetical protein
MQLVKWARQGEMGFELRINNPPYFMPFDASDRPNFPANDCELILHNAQILYLSRAATECASSIMICRSRKCGLRSTTRPRLVPAGLLCRSMISSRRAKTESTSRHYRRLRREGVQQRETAQYQGTPEASSGKTCRDWMYGQRRPDYGNRESPRAQEAPPQAW